MRPLLLLSLFVFAASAGGTVRASPRGADPQAQTLSDRATVVQGRVVTSDGMPIRRARLVVGSDAQPSQSPGDTFTDRDGRFEVRVPGGTSWRLRISKAGFAARTIGPQEIVKANDPGNAGGPLTITLDRGAVVAGEVVDQLGDPVVGAIVHMRHPGTNPAGGAGEARELTTDTDDRGAFRIGSLPAGEIEITVSFPLLGTRLDMPVLFNVLPLRAVVRTGEEVTVIVPATVSWGTIQSPATATGPASGKTGIRGRIFGPNDRPVRQAVVRAVPVGAGPSVSVSTNELGRFEIAGLPAGRFRVQVSKQGFPNAEYGQSRALQQGRVLSLRDGQQLQNIDITLTRGAVVTGRIVDAEGEPLEGVLVQAWRSTFVAGRVVVSPSETRDRRTDDRGDYRLHGLLPATYYIVAGAERPLLPAGPSAPKGLPVYYPGRAALVEAQALRIDGGQELNGLDMIVDPSPGGRVSGRAMDSAGRPLAGAALLSTSLRSGAPSLQPQIAQIRPQGSFEFLDVAPGEYVVQLMAGGPSGTTREFGTEFVRVDGPDAPPLTVTALPGSRVSGRIVLEGGPAGASPGEFGISLSPSDFDRSPTIGETARRAMVNPDWTFSLEGVTGVYRFLPLRAPEGWWLRSVTIDGVNAADDGVVFGTHDASREDVEVVFSRSAAAVTGRAVERREAVADYSVIAFPTDPSRRYDRSQYMKLVRSDQDGRFTVDGLPPGEYWVVAVDVIEGSAEGGDWMNPDVLNVLAQSARRIRLGEGQRTSVELELTRTAN